MDSIQKVQEKNRWYGIKKSILNIHNNMLFYHVTYTKEEIIEVLKLMPRFNNFESKSVISFINHVDKKLGEITENHWYNQIDYIFGREYSNVLYLKIRTSQDITDLIKYIKHIKHFMNADEFNIEEENGNIKIRIWFD